MFFDASSGLGSREPTEWSVLIEYGGGLIEVRFFAAGRLFFENDHQLVQHGIERKRVLVKHADDLVAIDGQLTKARQFLRSRRNIAIPPFAWQSGKGCEGILERAGRDPVHNQFPRMPLTADGFHSTLRREIVAPLPDGERAGS